jgi:hypothetical protein
MQRWRRRDSYGDTRKEEEESNEKESERDKISIFLYTKRNYQGLGPRNPQLGHEAKG